jgi:hypothetical protein
MALAIQKVIDLWDWNDPIKISFFLVTLRVAVVAEDKRLCPMHCTPRPNSQNQRKIFAEFMLTLDLDGDP